MRIASKPFHGEPILADSDGGQIANFRLQTFFDEIEERLNTNLLGDVVQLPVYTVLTLPDASLHQGGQVFVSNETGGAVTAFSDGLDWRRTTDRAVVS